MRQRSTARRAVSSARMCERLVERLLFEEGLDWYEVRRTVEAAMIRTAMRRTGYATRAAALLLGLRLRMLEQLLSDTHRGEGEAGARTRLRLKESAPRGDSPARIIDLDHFKTERER